MDGNTLTDDRLLLTRQAFYQRIGYIPEPAHQYVRKESYDTSLEYYERLLRPKRRA